MNLHVISSSSVGNCYVLQNETSALIIDAGVSFLEVQKVVDFKVEKIVGCLVSHWHSDHFKYANEYARRGIQIYCNESVVEKADIRYRYNFNKVYHGQTFKVGEYTIKPFDLVHDVPCLGFYIKHPETGNFCFITDTSEVNYKFGKLHNILIEANYEQYTIDTNDTNYKLRDRIMNSHLSISQVAEFLKDQDLSELNKLVLLHLSECNSNIKNFKSIISNQVGYNAIIAESNIVIPFNKEPF